jgi:hypothetical protein
VGFFFFFSFLQEFKAGGFFFLCSIGVDFRSI